MNIAFAGLRHDHIFVLANLVRQHPDFSLCGWWEADESARAAVSFAEPAYASYEALLADETVQAVAIGDYYGIRGQRVIQALKAGKHVICDKPVCTSLEELDEIEKLLDQTGLKLGCMLDLRYEACLRKLAQLVSESLLGDIKTAAFTGQHPLNWGVRPGWYFEQGRHGGTFNDIAIHGVDAIGWLTGQQWVKMLYARQWNAFAEHAPDFKDCAQCVGELKNGANVMADVSYAAPSPKGFLAPAYWRFTLWGTNGFAECRYGDPAVTLMLTGDPKPHSVQAPPTGDTCLTDFWRDVHGHPTPFDTRSVLQSSRAALQLQHYADQKG